MNVVRTPSLIAGVGRMHCASLSGCCSGLPGVWEMETVLELTSQVVKVFLRGSRVAGPVPSPGPGSIDKNNRSRVGQRADETQATYEQRPVSETSICRNQVCTGLTEERDCRYRYSNFRQATAGSDRWDGELKGVRGAGLGMLRKCRSHWVLGAQPARVAERGASASGRSLAR